MSHRPPVNSVENMTRSHGSLLEPQLSLTLGLVGGPGA